MPIANNTDKDVVIAKNTKVGRVTTTNLERQCEGHGLKVDATKNIVNTDDSPNERKTEELVVLINEFKDCFASNLREIGCTGLIKMDIVDDNVPVRAEPYKTSAAERQIIKDTVQEWKNCRIVSESAYASPVIVVPKKNGDSNGIGD